MQWQARWRLTSQDCVDDQCCRMVQNKHGWKCPWWRAKCLCTWSQPLDIWWCGSHWERIPCNCWYVVNGHGCSRMMSHPAVREGVTHLLERVKHTAVQWLQLVGTVRGVGEKNNARFPTKVHSSQRHVGVMIAEDQQEAHVWVWKWHKNSRKSSFCIPPDLLAVPLQHPWCNEGGGSPWGHKVWRGSLHMPQWQVFHACFWPLLARIFSGFWTVVTPVSSIFQISLAVKLCFWNSSVRLLVLVKCVALA